MTADVLAAVAGIIVLNLTLSGDNAVVIAMAARRLPGRQRRLAIAFGTAGAVGLRIVMTAVAAWLLSVPLLDAAGALILVWIACKLLQEGEESGPNHRQGESLWQAIQIMILADAVMSFDNVLAIAAVSHGNMPLLVFGLVLSMPVVMLVGGYLSEVMHRSPWLGRAGAAILAWTAGQMILEDHLLGPRLPHTLAVQVGVSLLMMAVVGGVALLSLRVQQAKRARAEQATTAAST